jgi:voltage-gated potassium channel
VVVAVAGFVFLAGISVVEASFWVIDPTSVELYFAEHEGPEKASKAFSILVRAGMVLSGLWLGETVLSAAFGGRIKEEFGRVHTKREIDRLSGHVVICGYGIFGRTVAERLRADGRDVVAIERDAAEFERIDTDEIPAIRGDARQEAVLQDAGIENAAVIVAAIDDSNANIQIAVTASQLAPEVRVIVRVGDEMYESLARRAGADQVVIPEVASGERVTDELIGNIRPLDGQ